MLQYNEITPKKFIELNNEPFEVISSNVFRKQQRKPVNQTKLKNLITGKVIEHSFQQSDKVEEASIYTKEVKYLYYNRGQFWFSDPDDPSDRFSLEEESNTIPESFKFIKENEVVTALVYDEEIIGFKLPIKVTLEVTEAPPAIKGNTASGGDKKITLETGAVITAPLFIETGDKVEVNIETEQYSGRV